MTQNQKVPIKIWIAKMQNYIKPMMMKLVLINIWMMLMRRKPKCRKPEKVVSSLQKRRKIWRSWFYAMTMMFFAVKPENAVNWMQKYGNPQKAESKHSDISHFLSIEQILLLHNSDNIVMEMSIFATWVETHKWQQFSM